MAFQPGQIVDHYRLDQIVARGRATVVFSASDLRLRRRVAFKVLNDDYAADRAFRERFAVESTTAAQLEHPHIVTVFDSNESAGSLYFVTQFIDGVTLQELLHRQPGGQPLLPAEAMIFLEQMASALDHAHRSGVVHRDVKPGNIMIRMTETPRSAYLIDFGINKQLDSAPADANTAGFIGTADYASPEQIRMTSDLDRRADVYSLACTAFEMLVGQTPFAAAGDEQDRIAAHLAAPIPSAVAMNSQLPPGLDGVFAKALAKDRVDRYDTCGAFVEALRRTFPADALEYRRIAAPASAAPAAPPLEMRRQGRGKVYAAIGAAAAVVAAALVAFVVTGDDEVQTVVGATTTTLVTTTSVAATTTSPTTTDAPTTTAADTTAPPTTVAVTTVPPPTTVLGPFGDEVGAVVDQPTTAQGATVFALQARRSPADIANLETPTYFYAQWLRLATPAATNPITASAGGYVIDADGPADLTQFELGTDGKVVTFTECTAACVALRDGILIDPVCTPGPNCIAFASASGGLVAFQRATINLRAPEITLLFTFTAPQPVTSVSDATGAVRYDTETGYFSVTLPNAPPKGTETVATVAFEDGTTSRLTITYG